MNVLKRSLYLGYYLKELDTKRFTHFIKQASSETNRPAWHLIADSVASVYKHNTGLMDYFLFGFYKKSDEERKKWVGTGYKYEFDLKTNPKNSRKILENKIEFYKAYRPFIKHKWCTIDDVWNQTEIALNIYNNKSGKIIIKNSRGQCGKEVEVFNTAEYDIHSLYVYMRTKGYDLAEEQIRQHPGINRLSPAGLNTVRMFTMVNNAGKTDILGARMRISVNNHTDNLAAGNIACPVDIKTGIISGKGVYSDIAKEPVSHHPVTGEALEGFQIPRWDEVIRLTHELARHHSENRGVGWDLAITEDGVDCIEGNHNWCKILWQLPVNQGLKHVLDQYDV